jgi:hypothetical protein
VAGKIIADIIEAPYDSIRMNVANVTVLTANSSGLTYVPTGNVNINIGGTSANLTMNLLTANGIKFPGTQVSSADANTLDDYEEGTWTPTVSGGSISGTGITYTGRYTKIGRLVTLHLFIDSSAADLNISSYVSMSGIPFSALTRASGVATSEDIDVETTSGFCQVGGSTFTIGNAAGNSSTTNLAATVTYIV